MSAAIERIKTLNLWEYTHYLDSAVFPKYGLCHSNCKKIIFLNFALSIIKY